MPQLTLTRISNFVRKEYVLIILTSLALIIFSLYIFNRFRQNESPTGIMWLSKIAPGETTSEQLKKALGEPIEATTEGSITTYSYPTTNEKRPTKVGVQENVVDLIQESVIAKEKGLLSDYIAKYGNPEAVLYGKYDFASPANFWGSKGLVVYGNPVSGLIIEIWYFPPMSLKEFLGKYPEFKLEPKHEDL